MHITVMFRSDVFRRTQARAAAGSPTPKDVFRKTQDAVVQNLRHSKLAMPSFAACVAKLDEMNSSLRAG